MYNYIKELLTPINYDYIPVFIFIFSLILFVIYLLKAQTNFINIRKIFTDYFSIFNNARKHLWFFWGIPFLIAFSIVWFGPISKDILGNIMVVLSIIVAMFFSMLSILVDKQNNKISEIHTQVLKETASAVLFEIVLCVFSLVLILGAMLIENSSLLLCKYLFSFLIYYFLLAMIINILILLKRFKALIDNP